MQPAGKQLFKRNWIGPSLLKDDHLTLETIYQEPSTVFPSQFFHILVHQPSLGAPASWSGSHFGPIFLLFFNQFVKGHFSVCSCHYIWALLAAYLHPMARGNFSLPLLSFVTLQEALRRTYLEP